MQKKLLKQTDRFPDLCFRRVGDVLKTNTAFPGLVVEYSQDGMKTWKTGQIKAASDVIPETYLRTRYFRF